jgi:hypothetical protein
MVRRNTVIACSFRPLSMSQRGLSGRMKPPRNISAAKSVMVKNMRGREVVGLLKALAMNTLVREIRKMPMVIINWKRVPMEPRMDAGAVSERKSGTTKDAMPTANPRAKRHAERTVSGGSSAETAEAAVKRKPAKRRLFLRPSKRAKRPDRSAPMIPPVANMAE